jgi:hypothetical protein
MPAYQLSYAIFISKSPATFLTSHPSPTSHPPQYIQSEPARKLDPVKVDEDTRSTIRAFCNGLVIALNRYYAFGRCAPCGSGGGGRDGGRGRARELRGSVGRRRRSRRIRALAAAPATRKAAL